MKPADSQNQWRWPRQFYPPAVCCLALIATGCSTLLTVAPASAQVSSSLSLDCRNAFNAGDFEQAIELAREEQESLGRFGLNESLPLLIIESQMATGKYSDALKTFQQAQEKYEKGIRLMSAAIDVFRFNNQPEQALQAVKDIEQAASKNAWLYRDKYNQLALGEFFLSQGADPKEVLNAFFRPALNRDPADPDVLKAIAKLSLDKADYEMAADYYQRLLKVAPDDTDALYGLAVCFRRSNSERATEYLNQALGVNPSHVDSLLMVADREVSAEFYGQAKRTINKVLRVNPRHPTALAYLAAISHLQNDDDGEVKFRNQALSSWKANPEVDHVIGRELSEKYRFAEGEKYQRRALVYDKGYLPAKIQLAHDLLRLGQEVEGWKLADEVFDEDQYSVLAHNLVVLRDEMSGFTTLTNRDFVVRMAPDEARIYGQEVLRFLQDAADQLSDKYAVELETPIIVEIFPRQQDFAIRTFGLPGGDGFLGVCFGRVITMNSPAAQGASMTSWKSVLWHEFCHVVTLQKTNNKMPRWLSEGISVYEEKQADQAWGESMSQRYREMLLNELTPVSRLSAAFLRPPSGAHLQFAYFQSSLAVEYLIQKHGLPALLQILDELSLGTPINEALSKYTEPMASLDRNFQQFATKRARQFAPQADWAQPELLPPGAGVDFWVAWNREHPDNLPGLLAEASGRLKANQTEEAGQLLEKAQSLCDIEPAVYRLRAALHQQLNQPDQERHALERYAQLEASEPDLYERLLVLTVDQQDWDATIKYARRLAAVDPLRKTPWEAMAEAATSLGNDSAIAEALTVLAEMNPLDVAELRYQLALAYFRLKDLSQAKRQVLMSLEQAPRYQQAHQLLLEINSQQPKERP